MDKVDQSEKKNKNNCNKKDSLVMYKMLYKKSPKITFFSLGRYPSFLSIIVNNKYFFINTYLLYNILIYLIII